MKPYSKSMKSKKLQGKRVGASLGCMGMSIALFVLAVWLSWSSGIQWVTGLLVGWTILSFLSERSIAKKLEKRSEAPTITPKIQAPTADRKQDRTFAPANEDGLRVGVAQPSAVGVADFTIFLSDDAPGKALEAASAILNHPDEFIDGLIAQANDNIDIKDLEIDFFGEIGVQIESVEFSNKSRPGLAEVNLADPMGVSSVVLLWENGQFRLR